MQDIEHLKDLTGGWIPSNLDGTEYKYSAVTKNSNTSIDFPVAFRLWTSGIKNQVDKGTCVAHALTSMKEIQDYYDTKSLEKYSTSWIYLVRQTGQYKGEGMIIKEALTNLKKNGVIPYSMLPGNIEYTDGIVTGYHFGNDAELKEEALKHRINSYVIAKTTTDIKKALYYDKSPVVIGVSIYESFYDIQMNGIVPIPNTTKEALCGGHAMIIIGWERIGNKNYWVVQNSWGENWGDNGFCYLEMDKFPIDEMWTSVDIEDYPCELIDISNHWAKEYIEKCVRAGLISGFEDKTFRADEPLTRGQLCTVLWKMLDKVAK